MQRISQHNILLGGDSFAHCSLQVHKFFDLTSLVVYDCIEIPKQQSVSGLDAGFMKCLDQAQEKNDRIIARLIGEISQAGIEKTEDFINIKQGYVSKTLHILSHFLDGFIGIDSYFYNLIDDSHWLFPESRQLIEQNPEHYWLLHVDGFASSGEHTDLLHS